MAVLVDTSVWVSHFRAHNTALAQLVEQDLVLTHPLVLAELACGTPPMLPMPRQRTLRDLAALRPANQATWPEIMQLIEREVLYNQGCGAVDVALLAATCITPGARLWTLDKPLASLAARFGVAYLPALAH
ncbi:MAG: type II toxin-antitoxin system VapC family toxin [Aeromonas sp.]